MHLLLRSPHTHHVVVVAGAGSTQVVHEGPIGVLEAMVVTPQHVSQKFLKLEVRRARATQDILFFVLVGFRNQNGQRGVLGSHVVYSQLLEGELQRC